MFKAFTWMFQTENFKKQFFTIFLGGLLIYALGFGLIFTGIQWLIPVAYLVSIIPTLYVLGYFWNLAEQIINREMEIQANSIYNGKIKNLFTITLPELNFLRNIWRGIASIFAIILLILPFIGLLWLVNKNGTFAPAYFTLMFAYLILLTPAMLWNYAYRDSVIAVWNLRKVIYIIGNYFFSYIGRVGLMVLIGLINYIIDFGLSKLLPTTAEQMANLGVLSVISTIFICLVFGIKYLYFVFVNAYLLGTIAPTSEA